VPIAVEPTSERASVAVDRLRQDYVARALRAVADRVFVGGAPAEARDGFHALDPPLIPGRSGEG
jgi:hypothetical protein